VTVTFVEVVVVTNPPRTENVAVVPPLGIVMASVLVAGFVDESVP
jgi:hypothetical protein